ncbi:MAG: hypothetical protein OXO50_23975 [Caldilineaceae bacterium]|nr:hypothetical protein [Caldilineaceae bacterium]
MEFFALMLAFIIAIVVGAILYALLSNAMIRLARALFRLPQGKHPLGWHIKEDFLFGKPLNRYERRERKGRIRN